MRLVDRDKRVLCTIPSGPAHDVPAHYRRVAAALRAAGIDGATREDIARLSWFARTGRAVPEWRRA